MRRSKASRGELEVALAQLRSGTVEVKGRRSDGSEWTTEERIAHLEARIAACPPETSKGRARVEAGRAKERERIEGLMEADTG